ncbi:hypothetical protein BDY17DRAFT_322094 [Neohortaea acidophila]|uniref:RRM domain-containing protein n=1 Tax=Neohortaea acidophila TaxID=245834 RepID=A0A6A6PZR3_9PEZI|nr:uncharacterized protein BDY17DRAFT_322094 [Neohortaea acidophila]KAF2485229.1 hypothetical protein BDY17DRAFT_322094 [Neohortaea acidophila]
MATPSLEDNVAQLVGFISDNSEDEHESEAPPSRQPSPAPPEQRHQSPDTATLLQEYVDAQIARDARQFQNWRNRESMLLVQDEAALLPVAAGNAGHEPESEPQSPDDFTMDCLIAQFDRIPATHESSHALELEDSEGREVWYTARGYTSHMPAQARDTEQDDIAPSIPPRSPARRDRLRALSLQIGRPSIAGAPPNQREGHEHFSPPHVAGVYVTELDRDISIGTLLEVLRKYVQELDHRYGIDYGPEAAGEDLWVWIRYPSAEAAARAVRLLEKMELNGRRIAAKLVVEPTELLRWTLWSRRKGAKWLDGDQRQQRGIVRGLGITSPRLC